MRLNTVPAGYIGEAYRYTQSRTQAPAVRGRFDRARMYMEKQNVRPVIGQASVFFGEDGNAMKCRTCTPYMKDLKDMLQF